MLEKLHLPKVLRIHQHATKRGLERHFCYQTNSAQQVSSQEEQILTAAF